MTIADVLRDKGDTVVTITGSAPVSDAVSFLALKNLGALVVLDAAGALIGIVSERDVVSHLAESAGAILERPVSKIMTADPLTCTRDATVVEVLQMMTGWNIRHLPVVENQVLFGLVSMGDLVKSTLDQGVFDRLPLSRLDDPDGCAHESN